MSQVRDLLSDEVKLELYRFTKVIIEERKDISIHQAMKHDSYKRVNRRIR